MSTIIRATDHPGETRAEAFNFDDMAARAQTYVDRVRAEAEQIVAAARQEADAIRDTQVLRTYLDGRLVHSNH